jgi:hypothetical protein
MTDSIPPALTPDEWAALEQFEPVRRGQYEVRRWRQGKKTGYSVSEADWDPEGSFLSLDPEIAAPTAALCLHAQPFGFTREDVEAVNYEANELHHWAHDAESEAEMHAMNERCNRLVRLRDKIAALLPPESK